MPSRVRNLVRDDLLLTKGGQNEKKQPQLFYSSVFAQKTEVRSQDSLGSAARRFPATEDLDLDPLIAWG